MTVSKFEIVASKEGKTQIYIDGRIQKGIKYVKFEQEANKPAELTIKRDI